MNEEPITTAENTYTILLRPEPGGAFTVTCPSLPGLVAYGAICARARVIHVDGIATLSSCSNDASHYPFGHPMVAPDHTV